MARKRKNGAAIKLCSIILSCALEKYGVFLHKKDREALQWGEQAYVIKVVDSQILLLAQDTQGVLYVAVSLIHTLRKNQNTLSIPDLYVRDFPDFEYRAF